QRKTETRDGERYLYRLAKARCRQAEDTEKFFGIKDENGHLLMDRKRAVKRWHDYFEEISNVEFAHPAIPFASPVYGPVQKITVSETEAALRKMKSGKATGPDDLPADLWKSKGWCPADWLTEFFNQLLAEKKVPESWQQSTTIPIWKKKGSPADCASSRPIRLLSHTMKIFERIVDRRIRDVVQLSTNQCGFVSGCGTVDAIHAGAVVRIAAWPKEVIGNAMPPCEGRRPGHLVLGASLASPLSEGGVSNDSPPIHAKAFDRVLREVIWYALRQHGVPEELIERVHILYSCPWSRVRAPAGTSMELLISVGMAAPWTLLYADDVMLACEDKTELEREAQAWCDRLALFGLKLNVKKTEYLTTDVNEHRSIKINGTELSRVTSFKYLGSTITSDGSLKLEVNPRVSTAWSKWRSLSGVLCDRTIPEHLKSKVYRTVVRPVAKYGAECWPVTKEIESRLSVMETKMLR
ncbi:unnamed protein product, partial [Heligmosomoides polygyrus]|uniref:Reverse transcriptase domain-containing protein n=1 Tax=Heligmosomoides polygyrus TaxID=6339 RepID=A0A183GG53_HELPZ